MALFNPLLRAGFDGTNILQYTTDSDTDDVWVLRSGDDPYTYQLSFRTDAGTIARLDLS